jgi:hypothetical protein
MGSIKWALSALGAWVETQLGVSGQGAKRFCWWSKKRFCSGDDAWAERFAAANRRIKRAIIIFFYIFFYIFFHALHKVYTIYSRE